MGTTTASGFFLGVVRGDGGRIEAGAAKSNWDWYMNTFWNPALTPLTADWEVTVLDDAGVASTLQGSQSANVPGG